MTNMTKSYCKGYNAQSQSPSNLLAFGTETRRRETVEVRSRWSPSRMSHDELIDGGQRALYTEKMVPVYPEGPKSTS